MFRDKEKIHKIIGELDHIGSCLKEYKNFFKTMNLDWNKKLVFDRAIDNIKDLSNYFKDELYIVRVVRGIYNDNR